MRETLLKELDVWWPLLEQGKLQEVNLWVKFTGMKHKVYSRAMHEERD